VPTFRMSPVSKRSQRDFRIGVDTGGTFTDVVGIREGSLVSWKLPTTPDGFQQAVVEGAFKVSEGEAAMLVHSTTVATNALLERKGAPCALVTTRGFRDVLEIGRQNRPDLYDLFPRRQPSLIPAHLRFDVTERVDAEGRILTPLAEGEVLQIIDQLKQEGITSVAVVLLFSFLDPTHEQRVGELLQQAGFSVSLSHRILPEFREVERSSTTCANAFVQPVMTEYLGRLREQAGERGLSPLQIVQSNGGTLPPQRAGAEAVRTLLSGPAAGVHGAMRVVRAGQPEEELRLITFDMGGTSTDVALIEGDPQVTTAMTLAGHPISVPMMNIHTVGAGGGSLAWVDAGGALRVGPQSAGAVPGPACYGRGGGPTVTDAHVVLGHLHPDRFLSGRMRLDDTASREALRVLGEKMGGVDAEEAARGVLRIANLHMENAIRVISVERGHDPADFTLVGFGGAGGLHSFSLAQALGIPRVLVPIHPGVLSALGAATGGLRQETGRTVMWEWAQDRMAEVRQEIAQMQQELRKRFEEDGLCAEDLVFHLTFEMRYRGQSHELGLRLNEEEVAEAGERFHALHAHRYGTSDSEASIQLVTLRLEGELPVPDVSFPPLSPRDPLDPELQASVDWMHRSTLRSGDRVKGPCILVDEFHTVVLPEGWELSPDRVGNLIGTRREVV